MLVTLWGLKLVKLIINQKIYKFDKKIKLKLKKNQNNFLFKIKHKAQYSKSCIV